MKCADSKSRSLLKYLKQLRIMALRKFFFPMTEQGPDS